MAANTQIAIELVVAPAHTGRLGELRAQQEELLDQIRVVETKIGELRRDMAEQESILAGSPTTDQEIAADARRTALGRIIGRERDKLAGIQSRFDALTPSVKLLQEERARLQTSAQKHQAGVARWAAIEEALQPIDQVLMAIEQEYRRLFPETCERLAKGRILIHATIGEQDQRRGELARIAARLEEIGE